MVHNNAWRQTSKMASRNICLALAVCIVVLQLPTTAKACRIARSPDKMEVVIPKYSAEHDSQEYQERTGEEATYWNREGDERNSKGESDYEKMENNGEANQERYENEKEYREKQQETNAKDTEDRYNNENNKAEQDQRTREEHYRKQEGDNNGEYYQSEGEDRGNDVTRESESKGGRYGSKGANDMGKEANHVENYEVDGKSPSFNYEIN